MKVFKNHLNKCAGNLNLKRVSPLNRIIQNHQKMDINWIFDFCW